jgi:hypothetical protein
MWIFGISAQTHSMQRNVGFCTWKLAISGFNLWVQGVTGSKGIMLLIMLKNFNLNCRNNRNISIFTSISYHFVFTRPPFLFVQHIQQYDTLLPITPCTHKLKVGIAYFECILYIFKGPTAG